MKLSHRMIAILLASMTACSCLLCSCKGPSSGKKDSETLPWENDSEVSALVDAIGGCSETYQGAVSEETYTSAQDAAKACVAQEIISQSKDCQIQTVSEGSKLSQKEISELGVPDDIMQGAEAVEEYTVTYQASEKDDQSSAASYHLQSLASKKATTVHVYIIKYPNYFKYFTPAVVNGDTLTKSYYDSIFNAEKYKNCTMVDTITITMDMDYEGTTFTMDMVTTTTTKYDHNKLYMQIEEKSFYSAVDPNTKETITGDLSDLTGSSSSSSSYALYVETQSDGSTLCMTNYGGTWSQASLSMLGFSDVDELTPFADQYLDHTFFTKTAYGCRLSKENFEAYLKQSVDSLSGVDKLLVSSGHADYYVSEGVLSGLHMQCDVQMTVLGIETAESISCTVSCTDYGTTVVEKPAV